MTGDVQPFLTEGAELAGYRVRSFIGRGGMAFVYLAEDLRLGRRVALKVLAPELAENAQFRRRFLQESRLAASLDHPNIVPIYEAGEGGGQLYIVMRYVDGSDLGALLDREGPLDLRATVGILAQVAAALDAAHATGLVHRDVKPGNILLAPPTGRADHGHVYLSDFGLTKRSSSLSGMTATGSFIGTMDYVAPEQIGGKLVDARTDVYALGCVAYQCLTGSVPFVRDDDAALLWAHLVEAPSPVSAARSDLPPGVDAVIAKAMAKAPVERYPSCGDFVTDLASRLDERSGQWSGERSGDPSGTATAVRLADPAGGPSPARSSGSLGVDQPRAESAWPGRGSVPEAALVPASSSAAEPTTPRAGRRRGRLPVGPGAVVTAVAVLIGVLAVVAFALRSGGGGGAVGPSTRFTRDTLVPYSFSYPASWRRAGTGTNVVFSPRAAELLALFSSGGSWTDTDRLLRQDPVSVVGLYTFFVSTQYDGSSPAEVEGVLRPLLPANASFAGVSSPTTVGGQPADRLDGQLSDPADSGSRLRFELLIVRLRQPQAQTVHLVFFAPENRFDAARSQFDRVAGSVDFSG